MASQLQNVLDEIRTHRRELFAELQHFPEEHLHKMTRWGRGPADARYLFLRYSDHEEEHAIQIEHTLRNMLGWKPSHVHLILATAERTRGDLLASLVGLGDEDLDAVPEHPQGEWPLRQTLAHLIATEHSYRINTLYAVEQHRKGEEHGDAPGRGDVEPYMKLTLDEMLVKLDDARTRTMQELSGLQDEDLWAPAVWSDVTVDANFRLMRFSHHEREHAAHIRKWRVQTGKHKSDAQRLLSLAWQSHGVLRGALAGVSEELYAADPGNDEWSVAQTLEHLRRAEDFFRRQIDAAT